MIIDDFDLLGSAVSPDKADSPLVVDANDVLSNPVSLQQFETISRWSRQVCQSFRLMDLPQLTLCHPLNIGAQSPRQTAMEQCFGIAIGEGADHPSLYTRRVMNVKRTQQVSYSGV